MTDQGWGNPEHNTYARRFIRLVAVDDYRVKVHTVLQPVVEHMLRQLAEMDLQVAKLEGHPASASGTGLQLQLSPDVPEMVEAAMSSYGYSAVDASQGLYEYGGSYEDAVNRGKHLDASVDLEEAAATLGELPTPPAASTADESTPGWWSGLPADRDLEPGEDASGTDVLFLQAYLVCTRTGVYDPETISAVNHYKAQRGLPEDGVVERDVWRNLVPQLRRHVRMGDNGRNVRLLTSALIARGALPREEPVSATYGIRLGRIIRDYQEAQGLRRSGLVAAIDWGTLLGYPWREMADR